MQVLAISNRGDDDLGFVGERLEHHGAELRRISRETLATVGAPEDGADLIVLLGSDWSVYDPTWREPIAAEQALVLRAQERQIPIFAICFGAQLAASAMGLAVTRAERPEIGWFDVDSDDPELCPPGPWFQFHSDRWHDGRGITSIARSPSGPQAFEVGRTLAVQFHPEVTAETAQKWVRDDPGAAAGAGLTADSVLESFEVSGLCAQRSCHEMVDRFLSRTATAYAGQGFSNDVLINTHGEDRQGRPSGGI
jgi:GMP synthase-like glutamine amidotransferase